MTRLGPWLTFALQDETDAWFPPLMSTCFFCGRALGVPYVMGEVLVCPDDAGCTREDRPDAVDAA